MPKQEPYPRWPPRGDAEPWMKGKVDYYRTHHPDEAYSLFDISSADYLPVSVHVSGNFGRDALLAYRRVKADNPDLVEKARASKGHLYSRSTVGDPMDYPDEPMLG